MVKLVIWDWNGTILDDAAVCYGIANDMRRERGMPLMPTVDDYREVFGFPIIDYYRRMGYTFEQESYEDISVEFHRLYMERVSRCPLRQGALDTIQAIRQRGVGQVLLSATGQQLLDEQIRLFGLTGRFDEVLGLADNLAYGKAELARGYIARAGVSQAETVFVGDTEHDFEVSSAVGCRALLLTGGHHSAQKLKSCGVPVLDSVRDVLAYI